MDDNFGIVAYFVSISCLLASILAVMFYFYDQYDIEEEIYKNPENKALKTTKNSLRNGIRKIHQRARAGAEGPSFNPSNQPKSELNTPENMTTPNPISANITQDSGFEETSTPKRRPAPEHPNKLLDNQTSPKHVSASPTDSSPDLKVQRNNSRATAKSVARRKQAFKEANEFDSDAES